MDGACIKGHGWGAILLKLEMKKRRHVSALFNVKLRHTCFKGVSAVFLGHPIAQVFHNLNTQGLRVRIPPET
mgnify:FL=1